MTNPLIDHLETMDETLAVRARNLWILSEQIHDRQNRPDSNENGRPHVLMVERNIWRLLSETTCDDNQINLSRFTATEIFLLTSSACCHDFDKALDGALPDDFVHGEGSADFVLKNAARLGLTGQEAASIASIVRLHDLKAEGFEKALRGLRRKLATPLGPVNAQLIAVLVKAGDVLHTDGSRIPELGLDAGQLDGLDRKKCLARSCIDGWVPDGTRIALQARPADQEAVEALMSCFDYMRTKEWPAVANYLEVEQFPYSLYLDNAGLQPAPDAIAEIEDARAPVAPEPLTPAAGGEVYRYPNRLATLAKMVVRVPVGISGIDPAGTLITRRMDIDCFIDTGAPLSVFRGDVASELGLVPTEASLRRVRYGFGQAHTVYFCEQDVLVFLGSQPVPVRVSFPAEPVRVGAGGIPTEFKWHTDFPDDNILAIGDVLQSRTVCFTSGALLVSHPSEDA